MTSSSDLKRKSSDFQVETKGSRTTYLCTHSCAVKYNPLSDSPSGHIQRLSALSAGIPSRSRCEALMGMSSLMYPRSGRKLNKTQSRHVSKSQRLAMPGGPNAHEMAKFRMMLIGSSGIKRSDTPLPSAEVSAPTAEAPMRMVGCPPDIQVMKPSPRFCGFAQYSKPEMMVEKGGCGLTRITYHTSGIDHRYH